MKQKVKGSGPVPNILIVDDNDSDVIILKKALESFGEKKQIHTVSDGSEALRYLERKGDYKDAPRPHLIILDINMPGMDGKQVLARIKGDPDFKQIPVVMLSHSGDVPDIVKSYELHANCYVRKPMGMKQLREIVAKLENFWFEVVMLPPVLS